MIDFTFSQFLSATMGPVVARVSAPRTIPSLKRHPTMVVPVLVALGRGSPRVSRNALLNAYYQYISHCLFFETNRLELLKSNPAP